MLLCRSPCRHTASNMTEADVDSLVKDIAELT